MSDSSIYTSVYTALGTLIVLLVTTLGGYIYTSSNNIAKLQENIGYLSKQVDRIASIIEEKRDDKSKILLLSERVKNLEFNTKTFMDYGDRFSRSDWELERGKMVKLFQSMISSEVKKPPK